MRRVLAIVLSVMVLVGCTSTKTPAIPPTAPQSSSVNPTPKPTPKPSLAFAKDTLAVADPSVVGMSDDDLKAQFGLYNQAGAEGVRYDVNWRSIEQERGIYKLENADQIARTAKSYGQSVLAILDYAPLWAAKSGCPGNKARCAPKDAATFIQFAESAVKRYAAQGIHHYELWNEPNLKPAWEPGPSAADYARLVREACPRIKQIDPQAVVVTGGLGLGNDGKGNIPMATFTEQFYNANPGDCYDAYGIHMYGSFAEAQLLKVRQLMVDYGHGSKLIWATEIGVETSGACGSSGNPSEVRQREQLTNIVATWRRYDWTGPIFWFTMKDVPAYNNHYGLVCVDGKPKPALAEFQKLARK